MGIAIIIPDVSFSESNIGQVTPTGNKPLVSLSISGNDSVIGREDAALYTVEYNPADTTQRGVVWSIVSGSAYATIDEGGYLTVLQGASGSSVTIRATSSKNGSIYAEKTITVTYEQQFTPLEELTARFNITTSAYFKINATLAEGDYIKAKFAHGKISGSAGCVVGSRQLANADTDANYIEIDTYQLNYQAIKSKFGGRYFYPAQGAVRYSPYTVIAKVTSLEITPSLGNITEGEGYSYTSAIPMAIGAMLLANDSATSQFNGDIYGVEIYGSNGVIKHRYIPQPDYTLLDEVTGTSYSKTGTGNIIYTAE